MPRNPQSMDLYQIWFRVSSRGRNQLCGILLQSAHGFRFCEGSKFAISHWLGWSPLTQCWRYRAACDGGGYTEGWRLDNANRTVATVRLRSLCGDEGVQTEPIRKRRCVYGIATEFIRCPYGDGGHFTAYAGLVTEYKAQWSGNPCSWSIQNLPLLGIVWLRACHQLHQSNEESSILKQTAQK